MLITLPVQTDKSLDQAEKLLKDFDNLKETFSDVEGCSEAFPKLHSLAHYIPRIRTWSTPDNYDTEYTEHQHIADAKQPYRRTNKNSPLGQMVMHRAQISLRNEARLLRFKEQDFPYLASSKYNMLWILYSRKSYVCI